MRSVLLVTLVLSTAFAFGAEKDVLCKGSSICKSEVIGTLDLSKEPLIRFEGGGKVLEIPYAKITAHSFQEPTARHLGVLPAIGVGLVAHRIHHHIFTITYTDEAKNSQVAILQVPREIVPILSELLRARVPKPAPPAVANICCASRSGLVMERVPAPPLPPASTPPSADQSGQSGPQL